MGKELILYVTLSLLSTNSICQGFVGKVIDSITKEPIPFAHVYLRLGAGTISNESGDFNLETNISKSDSIIISHVSYESIKIPFNSDPKHYIFELSPLSITLSEVIIYDKGYIDEFIEKVYQRIKKNDKANFGKAFYRQITYANKTPTEIQEIFLDISYSARGLKKYSSSEARYAKKVSTKENPIVSMSNQLYLVLGFDLTPDAKRDFKKPFDEDFKTEIDFTIIGSYASKNNEFLEFSYKPRNSNYGMEGTLTINKKNYCICKFTGNTKNSLGMDTLRSSVKNEVATNHHFSWDVGFDCEDNSNPALIYSIVKTSFTASVYGKIEVDSKLIVYERKHKSIKNLKEFEITQKDMDVIKSTKYHPKFWKNNEIVKRTPIEKKIIESFEGSNSFGNYKLQNR